MASLTVRRMKLEDIPIAFPLVSLHHKDLTLSQWTDLARGVLSEGNDTTSAGFILVCDSQGTIFGIAQFEKCADAKGDSKIVSNDMMVCGLFQKHRDLNITALQQALNQMAQEAGSAQFVVEHPARLPLSPATS